MICRTAADYGLETEDQEEGILGVGTAKKALAKGNVSERDIEAASEEDRVPKNVAELVTP